MLNLTVQHWKNLHLCPLFNAHIKSQLSDFKVIETLSFEPSGDGEHTFLHIEKTGLNTAYVAEEIAKFAKLPLRAVSYAGRKDKFATTSQWFGIYFGGKQAKGAVVPDWNTLAIDGVKILDITKNQRKLRTGAIKNNGFEIILRKLTNIETNDLYTLDAVKHTLMPKLQQRLDDISRLGVPNYYGNQRFGELIKPDGSVQLGGNLIMAERLINGEEIRNRNKRSMAISALRSWLFNQAVSYRLAQIDYNQIMAGDALALAGTNSFFIYDEQAPESAQVPNRIEQRDVQITAPLWGKGRLDSVGVARTFEESFAQQHPIVCQALVDLDLEQQRRAVLLFPQNAKVELIAEDQKASVKLSFSLPSGCFATSVLKEIAKTNVGI